MRVYNKIDKAADGGAGIGDDARFAVSAVTGAGLHELREAIGMRLRGARYAGRLTLGPAESRLRAKLFDWHAVRGETIDADGVSTLEVELTAQRWRELQHEPRLPANARETIREKL